jgi:hypothetical protein
VRGEGYEPVHTSTIERFYRCFYKSEPFVHFHRVECVDYTGFADWRGKGLDGVNQNPIEIADTEICALYFIHFVLGIGLKHGFSDNFTRAKTWSVLQEAARVEELCHAKPDKYTNSGQYFP